MTVVPVAMPDTMPEAAPTLPTDGLLLLHVPPLTASVNVIVVPIQSAIVPMIADGDAFTVSVVVTEPHAVV